MKKIYLIISAYNEEENIPVLLDSLEKNLQSKNIANYEMVFVNDGSSDQTLAELLKAQKVRQNIIIVNQSKNFGHEIAAEMIQLWEQGKKLILTQRTDNEDKGLRYKILGNTYYWILNTLSDVKIPRNMPDFRLLDKKYVLWINSLNETDRMFRGMLSLVGLQNAHIIPFVAPKRNAGKSNYNFFNLYKLAIDSVIQFSVKPLRLATFIGVLGCLFSILFLAYSIYDSWIHHEPRTGYLTLLSAVIFFCSLIIFFLGIIGEYIGRIHIEVKNRPLYFNEVFKNEEK